MPKVDLENYLTREQAYIKHCLLQEYLPDWAYKVGGAWDDLVYVDGFAGPWQTKTADLSDTSFGIAIQAMRECQAGIRAKYAREVHVENILVDQDRNAFKELKRFADEQRGPAFDVHALYGEFVEKIGDIEAIIKANTKKAFRFIFLDPKGWADIPMKKLAPFLKGRSSEVLITLMTRHILRFLDEPDRERSFINLFARKEVLDNLRREDLRNEPPHSRAEQAVREYGLSLKLLCGFKYVSCAVILEPDEEAIRYFLVYATNHPSGVEVFKNAETKAARIQDQVRHDTHVRKTGQPGFLFDDMPPGSKISLTLRDFYVEKARKQVLQILSASTPNAVHHYADLFCEAMAFPLVTADDLVNWLIDSRPNVRLDLDRSPRRRKPSPLEHDKVVVVDPKALR